MFTRVNAACSVMLGRTLPRVGKVAGSEEGYHYKAVERPPHLNTLIEMTRASGGGQPTMARAVPKIK